MASPINSDNISTQQAIKSRNFDAPAAQRAKSDAAAARAERHDDSADVGRANQRLAQEVDTRAEPALSSPEQARARIAQLQIQIAAEPRTVVQAHSRVDADLVQAAMARPAA